jgi:hypothetical protein
VNNGGHVGLAPPFAILNHMRRRVVSLALIGATASVLFDGGPADVTLSPMRVASPAAEPAPVAASATEEPSSEAADSDIASLDEMLRGSKKRVERWTRAPELVVLMSVMQFRADAPSEYVATSSSLSDSEADDLVSDLTAALTLLTDNTFQQFAAVHREVVAPGAAARVVRPNQIVVGRYRDVHELADTIGFGGRAARADGSITGAAIILDEHFDRTSASRVLLRTHELGHALGYNHVQSRRSVMNPRIGTEPTEFDRRAAAIAFSSTERSPQTATR